MAAAAMDVAETEAIAMAAEVPTHPTPAVEVHVSSPGFSDVERTECAAEKAARAFARDVIRFVLNSPSARHKKDAPAISEAEE